MKKHLLFYTFLVLLGWCVCPQAWAYDVEVNGVYYNLSGANAIVTYPGETAPAAAGDNSYTGAIVIPATIESGGSTYNVTQIAENAFRYATITSVTFSEGLQVIGTHAFDHCQSLASVEIPNTVTNVNYEAFASCHNLLSITFGAGTTNIGQGVCYDQQKKQNIYVKTKTVPSLAGYAFFWQGATIHVYADMVSKFSTAANWNDSRYTIVGDLERDYTFDELQAKITELSALGSSVKDAPGFYSVASYAAVQTALDNCASVTATSPASTINNAMKALVEAGNACQPLPITEGYYYIVTAGKGPGYPFNGTEVRNTEYQSAIYTDGSANRIKWKAYAQNDYTLIFKLTANGSNWNVQNLVEGTYMGVTSSTSSYGDVTIPAVVEPTAQHFDWIRPGKFGMKGANNSYYYAQAGNHNGSTNASGNLSIWGTLGDATSGGMNQWFLIPVDESTIIAYQETLVGDLVATANDYKAKVAAMKTGTAPGLNNATKAQEMLDAADKAIGLASSTDLDAKLAVVEEMKTAWLALVGAVNPITEGYYYIVCDNANIAANGKSEKALYINTEKNELWWGELETADLKYAFKLSKKAGTDTWYLQNVDNGLYAGAAVEFCGRTSATATPDYPVTFFLDGEGSYRIKANNWTYCPQGNPGGTSAGPSYVWGYNATGMHGEASYTLRPISAETVNTLKLAKFDAFASQFVTIPASDDPNFYAKAEATAYNAVVNAASSASTDEEKLAAYDNLLGASALLTTINPITEGYYFITSAGKGSGYSGGPYNYEDKNALYNDGGIVKWKAYDKTDVKELYYLTETDGGWFAYNVADKTYINRGSGNYSCDLATSETATNAQSIAPVVNGNGKFTMTWVGNIYPYGLNNSHNGSSSASGKVGIWGTVAEAKTFGINQWFLHKVSAAEADELMVEVEVTDGVATFTAYKTLDEASYLAALEGIDKTKVRSIDLSTVNVNMVPTQVTNPFENTNTMFYMADDYAHPNEGINLVTQGKCPSLILVDKEDFVPAKAFEAKNATYLKTGSLDTEGWYSVVLPFDYVVDASLEVLNNAVVKDATIAFSAVEAGETIPAGTPFIYKSKVDGPFSILQVNVNCSVAANATPSTSGALKGTYVKIPKGSATGKYILKADGSAFAEATANASIPAFRAYIDGIAGSGTFTITINDDLTGVVGADADLNAKVDVYSVDGKLVRQGVESITALQGLESGIYIINGKTIKK